MSNHLWIRPWPGMPNQMFEWVEPRQRFCTQCHYDNFLGTPTATYSLLEKSGAAAIIGECREENNSRPSAKNRPKSWNGRLPT